MRARDVLVLLTTSLLLSSSSSLVLTVPLEWVDRQAYVATVPLNGVATRLQISTMLPYSWVACGLQPPGLCQPTRCETGVYAETRQYCATLQDAALTLRSSSSDAALSMPSVALRVAQYHNLSQLNDSDVVYTPPAMKPDYSSEQPLLVASAQGELGLGRGNATTKQTPIASQLKSFSLFVTTQPSGSELLLDVGPRDQPSEPFTPGGKLYPTTFTLPLRDAASDDDDEQLLAVERWDLSLRAVRFAEDAPLYPRVYTWSDTVGSDAAATLSLNHAVLQMPSKVLARVVNKYLTSCTYGRNTVGNRYFSCGLSVRDELPRITFFLGEQSFYLDPADYTHISPTNASAVIVQLEASADNARWVLGAPFLRKFPTQFVVATNKVTLFCDAGTSCRSQSVSSVPEFLEDPPLGPLVGRPGWSSDIGDENTSSPVPTSTRPYYGYVAYEDPSPMLLAAIWIGRCIGVFILLTILLRTVVSCRDRILGRRRGQIPEPADETGTVASERDLEEAKEELRAMAAAEEAQRHAQRQRHRRRTSPVEDDTDYELIQSPRLDQHQPQPNPNGTRV